MRHCTLLLYTMSLPKFRKEQNTVFFFKQALHVFMNGEEYALYKRNFLKP